MVVTVEIDNKTKTGKSLLHLLKGLSKTSEGVHFIETIEDDELLSDMKVALKSGKSSKRTVTKTLKSILVK